MERQCDSFLRRQLIFIFFLLNMVPFNQFGFIYNINMSAQNIFTFHQKIWGKRCLGKELSLLYVKDVVWAIGFVIWDPRSCQATPVGQALLPDVIVLGLNFGEDFWLWCQVKEWRWAWPLIEVGQRVKPSHPAPFPSHPYFRSIKGDFGSLGLCPISCELFWGFGIFLCQVSLQRE